MNLHDRESGIEELNEVAAPADSENTKYPKGSTAMDIKNAFDQSVRKTAKNSEPPEHWPQEDKAAFQQLDDKTKSWLIQRHRSMEADYTKKTMDLSKDRKKMSDLQKVISAYENEFKDAGLDEIQAVEKLLYTYRNLKRDPKNVIKEIAQATGVDLSAAISNENAASSNDIRSDVERLKNILAEQNAQHKHLTVRMGQQKIDEFKSAKDATGKPVYAHFEALLPQIVMLAHADLVQGRQPDLKDLYDRASWAHPETRQQLLEAQLETAAKKKAELSKTKVESAKRAGASVHGTPHTDQSNRRPSKSLREELEAAFRDSIHG